MKFLKEEEEEQGKREGEKSRKERNKKLKDEK